MVSEVYVIGMGMGNPDMLTCGAMRALESSELVIGSSRLLDSLADLSCRKVALVSSKAILDEIRTSDAAVASVVMSGDVGFYSGATSLMALLQGFDVHVIPGISSLSYFCARLGIPWQDVYATSAHGRECDAAGAVQAHARSFFLTGGTSSVSGICAELVRRGLGEVYVHVGERLSYADERLCEGTAAELSQMSFDPLSVLLVENERPLSPEVSSPFLPDEAFLRGSVPMTKEEVRELAVCKLRIRPTDTVWDVGCGTGSVSVEVARAAWKGQVFAIDRNEEAQALTKANVETFALTNVRVIAGEAPAALVDLPAPDRVFVGGTAGCLEDVLALAIRKNPQVRLCVPAVTLETLSEAMRCARELGLNNVDVVQVSVARAHEVGSYHMMRSENPVHLVVADGPEMALGSEGV